MSILCPFDMLIHGINIQLNGAESIDISFSQNLQIRLIPVRSRVRISPLLFFYTNLKTLKRKITNWFVAPMLCIKDFDIKYRKFDMQVGS